MSTHSSIVHYSTAQHTPSQGNFTQGCKDATARASRFRWNFRLIKAPEFALMGHSVSLGNWPSFLANSKWVSEWGGEVRPFGPTPAGSRCCFTNSLVTYWFTDSSFSSQSLWHHKSQTVRARELTFWETVHPPPSVTRHMSCVTYQVSIVKCQVSGVFFFIKWWS